MTKTRTPATTKIELNTATECRAEALSWVSRQLRFEHLLTSLEHRSAR